MFGASITIGEAWQRVRGRLLPLFGYMMLWLLAVAVPVFIVVFVIVIVVQFSGAVAFVLAIPLGLGLIALLVYLWTVLSFAPPLIVLERLGVFPSITRSIRLVKGDFWRVLGIRLLATLVAGLSRGRCRYRSASVGQIMLMASASTTTIADRTRARRRSAARSARSSPRRSARAWWCCSTPTGGSGPRRSTWCCRPGGDRGTGRGARLDRPPVADPAALTCPTIDIDRDAAHEAAQRELAKPIYPKASLTERLSDWLDELLYRIAQEGSSLPGGWFTVTVLLIILAVAVVVAVRIARRTMRTNRGGERARCSIRTS